ncbi:hypothetical protein [Pseudomonas syringae]|uniref:phosphoribosyltransferase-like protein n=1 Tax=Pseudomonas syringae TaxID=317 RepID=UPI000A25F899|nr:hypothetical protein [Pseudomonas syringae]MBL3606645.1 hypothetical protein [Pseudomonas syringae pv. actinidiae]OSS32656.1 hypothetical protein BV337_00491 [Pseudomonas syringae pv. actinidiae]
MELDDRLKRKIEVLASQAWDNRLKWPDVQEWLQNFTGEYYPIEVERSHAIFLLSQVMFFGQDLLREMLKSVYENLYRHPIITKIRRDNNDTLDEEFIEARFAEELAATRFLGVGNPSESGPHLLYYFRQVNDLPKDLFIDSGDIYTIARQPDSSVKVLQTESTVKRYVFIDDLLGSGTQISDYLTKKLNEISHFPGVESYYYSLFATSKGLGAARGPLLFGTRASCVYELDKSFRCFSEGSRTFANIPDELNFDIAKAIASGYGKKLVHSDLHALGYKDGQLLISFLHNTPDNSLPILWFDVPKSASWKPVFKRFDKKY